MEQYNPETHVAVPKSELAKLEEARVNLIRYIGERSPIDTVWELMVINEFTQQIWKVVNQIKW